MTSKIKYVLFDFDGTLFDTERKRFNDMQRIFKKHGHELSDTEFIKFCGSKTMDYLKNNHPHLSEELRKDMIKLRRELQYMNFHENKLLNGVRELLNYLKEKNMPMAIVTGSTEKFVKALLNEHDMTSFFKFVVHGDDLTYSKPHPESYEKAMKRVHVEKDTVIAIEDSLNGIKSAKAINLKVFALLTYNSKDELPGADYYFPSHIEILEFLKKQSQ